MKNQAGYTLLELMITVAILTILMAQASAFLKGYQARARVAEGLLLATPIKQGVFDYYATEGSFPVDNRAAGAADPRDYLTDGVEEITVSGDTIAITYAITVNSAPNNTLNIKANPSGNRLLWTCNTGSLPSHMRPSNCR